jgi:hypothetical protein
MSEVKVNKISPRTNCGTVQLGDSGDTITIPAGATITNNGTAAGFGATGAASWDTTVKTSGFTAVSGVGYFVNTTSGAITVTLPASPAAGAVVAVKDYANTFDTNNVTLARNGSNIGGTAEDATLLTEGIAVTLVYVDATQGWLVTDSGLQSEAPGPQFVAATGGTITCCGDYKIHTFTGPGTFTVTCAGNPTGSVELEYIVVAGGGGGGGKNPSSAGGGGGGAGGFRFASPSLAPATYPGKPRAAPSAITASVQAYPITVGGGGPGGPNNVEGGLGNPSIFSTITSAGGGKGVGGGNQPGGSPGGSGGGTYFGNPQSPSCGHSGNVPPVSPPQGMPGGPEAPPSNYASGGGGAMVAGSAGNPTGGPGGNGAGIPTAFGSSNGVANPSPDSFRYYAGGGAGGGYNCGANGVGGLGGGGNAYIGSPTQHSGVTNSGGGGGSVGAPGVGGTGGSGGSGIVIIRYKFQ